MTVGKKAGNWVLRKVVLKGHSMVVDSVVLKVVSKAALKVDCSV